MKYEIFDNILTNFETRFSSLNKLEFISLIDPTKYANYNKEFRNAIFLKISDSQILVMNLIL